MSTEDRPSYEEDLVNQESHAASARADHELDETSRRLEDMNWEPFPPHARPGRKDSGENDNDPFTAFAEDQLHQRPITTLVAAVAAGWIVGKLLR